MDNSSSQNKNRIMLVESHVMNHTTDCTIKSDVVTDNKSLYDRGVLALNPFQLEILHECQAKTSGGLDLPVGSGTLICSNLLSFFPSSHFMN
jgi:hypothetical protein